MSWMTSQYRKRYQRAVNKVFRNINNAIKKDELWRGRFMICQHSTWFTPGDCECPDFMVEYYYKDLKTGYKSPMHWASANNICWFNGSKLFWEMNDFIVEKCRVWEKEGRDVLFNDKTIYR